MIPELDDAECQGMTCGGSCQNVANRITQILAGHSFLGVFNWLFDNPLYLCGIYRMGHVEGGMVTTMLSLIVSLALLIVYERMRVDWLGVNVLETVKE